jgi:hypothetical protein
MPKLPFSEKAADHLLHRAFHGAPDNESAAALGRGWREMAESHFTFTAAQREVLDGITPEGSELIQSTLDQALAQRATPRGPEVVVRFVQAPSGQSHPVDVRVERGRKVNGVVTAVSGLDSDAASGGTTNLTAEEIGFWIILIATIIKVECF